MVGWLTFVGFFHCWKAILVQPCDFFSSEVVALSTFSSNCGLLSRTRGHSYVNEAIIVIRNWLIGEFPRV